MGVLKNAPHKEEAIKLLMYWCRPVIAEKWMRMTKGSTGINGSLTRTDFGIDQFENYMYTIEKKYGDRMIQENDFRSMLGEKNKWLPLGLDDILSGKITANEAFEELKKKMVH